MLYSQLMPRRTTQALHGLETEARFGMVSPSRKLVKLDRDESEAGVKMESFTAKLQARDDAIRLHVKLRNSIDIDYLSIN